MYAPASLGTTFPSRVAPLSCSKLALISRSATVGLKTTEKLAGDGGVEIVSGLKQRDRLFETIGDLALVMRLRPSKTFLENLDDALVLRGGLVPI
jgi:hypothetical protein